MLYPILSSLLGVCFFMVPIWAYRKGLKDGLNINKGKDIEPIKTPMQIVKNHYEEKRAKEETDRFIEGFSNLMSYDGTPQKVGEED